MDHLKGVECNPRPLGRHNVEVGKYYLAEPRDKNRVSLVCFTFDYLWSQEFASSYLAVLTYITKFLWLLVLNFTGSPIHPSSRCSQTTRPSRRWRACPFRWQAVRPCRRVYYTHHDSRVTEEAAATYQYCMGYEHYGARRSP